jgi:hypothetical protein
MRHLFVPACVCLMTWSSATGSDPKISIEQFPGPAKRDEKVVSAPAETGSADAVHAEIPIDMTATDIAREAPGAEPQPQNAEAQAIGPVPLPPIAKPVVHRSREEVCDTLTKAAESNNLPVPFFISLLFQESRFQPGVVSSAGAQGVAQFMPETAASMGLKNPFDPLEAIPASARLLRNLVSQFGNLGLAAAAYNAGPKRIQDWLGKKGKLPDETKGYVKTITGRPAENWTAASAEHPGQRLPRRAPCQEAAGLYAANGPETIPLPQRSPLAAPEPIVTARAVTPARAKVLAAASSHKIKLASADTTSVLPAQPAATAAPIKIAKLGARYTAVINIANPEPKPGHKPEANSGNKHEKSAQPAAKPVIEQLAARKQHKSGKHKFEKVAAQ